jgi:hypothetical protein
MKNSDTTNYSEMTPDDLHQKASELASLFRGDSAGSANYALYQLARIHHEIDKRAADDTHRTVMKHANRALFIAAASLVLAVLPYVLEIGFTVIKSSTARSRELELTQLKGVETHRKCNTICVSTNEPCLPQGHLETEQEANKTQEHISEGRERPSETAQR